jgi:hypothetical protein
MTSAGSRVLVQKAYAQDFDKVYTSLLAAHDPRINQEDWRQLFIKHWDIPEDYHGYMLIDNEEVVGFLGTIFSTRKIHDQEYRFCNLTSWIVKPEFRNKSLFLLFPLLKLADYNFTNLSAQEHVAAIHRQLGFTEIGSRAQILLPLSGLFSQGNIKYQIIFDHNKIHDCLQGEELNIFRDHLRFKCSHILLESANDYCYLVASKLIKKMVPILYIHYIGNLHLFLKLIHKVALKLLCHFQSLGLLLEDRFVAGVNLPGAIKYNLPQYKLFKSPSLQARDIDNLYSERILLHY